MANEETEGKQDQNKISLGGEDTAALKNRVETLRNLVLPDSNIPDIRRRLIAVGLIDQIEGYNSITLPGADNYTIDPGIS